MLSVSYLLLQLYCHIYCRSDQLNATSDKAYSEAHGAHYATKYATSHQLKVRERVKTSAHSIAMT